MVLARSCALTAVSSLLAEGMQRSEPTVRQRLREWYYDTKRKRGPKRQALRVETCFAPLLGWVVSGWQGTQLALAIDATALGARFVMLAVSVVYRGCAVPVAWVVLPANTKHAWRREWLRLLRRLRPAIPRGWTVGSDVHVMLALCRRSREVVVADEELNGPDMVGDLLGKR